MSQRLVNKEIDDRVHIVPNKTIKKDTSNGINGLMLFGINNDYPQVMEKLINGSVTAKAASRVYAKFLTGDGFENEVINDIVVGRDARGKSITVRKLLRAVATSISKFQGAFIHCNFNRDGAIVDVHTKPFKNCRYALADDVGYSAKILVYDNWQKDRNLRFDKALIKDFNVFNAERNVFLSQVKAAEGIEKYKGQIYPLFTDDEYFYPLSTFDEAYLDCDTEAQLALFRNRQTRNGFFKKTILRIQESLDEEAKKELAADARRSLGVDGDGLWIIEDEVNKNGEFSSTQGFAVDQLDSNLDDDKFKDWSPEIANNIRKSAKGIPAVLIDYEENKLGTTSGEAIIQATNYYNAILSDERDEISSSFQEIFTKFNDPLLANNTNWKIKPLNLLEQQKDGVTNNSATKPV